MYLLVRTVGKCGNKVSIIKEYLTLDLVVASAVERKFQGSILGPGKNIFGIFINNFSVAATESGFL